MYGLFLTSYVIMTVYLTFNAYYVGVAHIDTMFIAKVMCNAKQKVTNDTFAGYQKTFSAKSKSCIRIIMVKF